MAAIGKDITDKVAGDDIPIFRTYRDPINIIIVKAWLTVKENLSDVDADAIIGPKDITAALTLNGQITAATTVADALIAMNFTIFRAESILCVPKKRYFCDVQVLTSTGAIHTMELFGLKLLKGVTDVVV